MMAVRPGKTPKIKDLIRTQDPNCVVVIAQANEVLGGGFKPLFASSP
jgi:uncharacterized membrane-anchored protein YitT (DUF2179 family)